MVSYASKSSSVTKRNNVDCMESLWFAPIYAHWHYIGDRKPHRQRFSKNIAVCIHFLFNFSMQEHVDSK